MAWAGVLRIGRFRFVGTCCLYIFCLTSIQLPNHDSAVIILGWPLYLFASIAEAVSGVSTGLPFNPMLL